MSRNEFIKIFEGLEEVKYVSGGGSTDYTRRAEKQRRFKPDAVFKPRDEWNEEKFIEGIVVNFKHDKVELFELLNKLKEYNHSFDSLFGEYVWPRQEKKAREWWDDYGKDNPSKKDLDD